MTVMSLNGLEDRQAAHAGIEDADGQVTQVSTIVRGDEAGRDIAFGMGLGMRDGGGDDLVLRKGGDRQDDAPGMTEVSPHDQVRSVR